VKKKARGETSSITIQDLSVSVSVLMSCGKNQFTSCTTEVLHTFSERKCPHISSPSPNADRSSKDSINASLLYSFTRHYKDLQWTLLAHKHFWLVLGPRPLWRQVSRSYIPWTEHELLRIGITRDIRLRNEARGDGGDNDRGRG
jgi:hypothetical protein